MEIINHVSTKEEKCLEIYKILSPHQPTFCFIKWPPCVHMGAHTEVYAPHINTEIKVFFKKIGFFRSLFSRRESTSKTLCISQLKYIFLKVKIRYRDTRLKRINKGFTCCIGRLVTSFNVF